MLDKVPDCRPSVGDIISQLPTRMLAEVQVNTHTYVCRGAGDIFACVIDVRSTGQSMIARIDEVSAKSRENTEQGERDRDVNVFYRHA